MSKDTTTTTPDPEQVKQGRKNAIERLSLTRPLVMRLYEGFGLMIEHLAMQSDKGDGDAALIMMTCHLLTDTIKEELNYWLPVIARTTTDTDEGPAPARRTIKTND